MVLSTNYEAASINMSGFAHQSHQSTKRVFRVLNDYRMALSITWLLGGTIRSALIHWVSLWGKESSPWRRLHAVQVLKERAGATCYSNFPNREDLERQIIPTICGWFDGCAVGTGFFCRAIIDDSVDRLMTAYNSNLTIRFLTSIWRPSRIAQHIRSIRTTRKQTNSCVGFGAGS